MKFWQALREMERGAVCVMRYATHTNLYCIKEGEMHWCMPNEMVWSLPKMPVCNLPLDGWSIHAPAPNSEPFGDSEQFDPIEHLRKGGKVRTDWWDRDGWIQLVDGHLVNRFGAEVDSIAIELVVNNREWIPVRETFEFMEAWTRAKKLKKVGRPNRPGQWLQYDGEGIPWWVRKSDGSRSPLLTEDIDATDYYELPDGN